MTKPTTIEEVLLAFENDNRKDSIGEEANEGYGFLGLDEALAAIEQLVLERVIGEDEPVSYGKGQIGNTTEEDRNELREEQRQTLRKLMGDKE